MAAAGTWNTQRGERGTNLLDGGRPWYDVYETADGQHMAVGALEPRFYEELLARTGLRDEAVLPERDDPRHWPDLRARLDAVFKTRTQAQWSEVFAGSDACVSPVLSLDAAAAHPHLRARGTYAVVDGVLQAMPAPRFSSTPGAIRHAPPAPGEGGEAAMNEWGVR